MPPTPDALTTRVRELLGKARVVYWDDTEASDRLRALQHSLEDTDGSPQVTPTDDPGRAGEALAQLRALLTENPRRGSETVASDCAALAGSVTVRPADSTPAPTLEQPHEEESDAAGVAGLAPEDAARARELLTASAAGDFGGDLLDELAHWRSLANDPSLPRRTRGTATHLGRLVERLLG